MFSFLRKLFAPKELRRRGMMRHLHAGLVLRDADIAVKNVCGSDTSADVKSMSWRDGILNVVCERPVHAEEIRLRREDIKREVNHLLGSDAVLLVRAEIKR